MLARTKDARGLVDTVPGRAWQRACQAMRLLGDPHLPNGVSDESVRIEARTTLLAALDAGSVGGGAITWHWTRPRSSCRCNTYAVGWLRCFRGIDTLDGPLSRRITVMRALSRATVIITE